MPKENVLAYCTSLLLAFEADRSTPYSVDAIKGKVCERGSNLEMCPACACSSSGIAPAFQARVRCTVGLAHIPFMRFLSQLKRGVCSFFAIDTTTWKANATQVNRLIDQAWAMVVPDGYEARSALPNSDFAARCTSSAHSEPFTCASSEDVFECVSCETRLGVKSDLFAQLREGGEFRCPNPGCSAPPLLALPEVEFGDHDEDGIYPLFSERRTLNPAPATSISNPVAGLSIAQNGFPHSCHDSSTMGAGGNPLLRASLNCSQPCAATTSAPSAASVAATTTRVRLSSAAKRKLHQMQASKPISAIQPFPA